MTFILILAPILLIALLFKLPIVKGMFGEFFVNFALSRYLNQKEYTLFKNVTMATENGSTQIDHILVSKYGVFVLETKNYKGWIFGSEKQAMWTQQIYRVKNQFQNPLFQNYKHTQTLTDILTLKPEQVFSIIVFIGSATIKTKMPANVGSIGQAIRFIKSHNQVILNNHQVQSLCYQIKNTRLAPTLKTHLAHAKHVQDIIQSKDVQTSKTIEAPTSPQQPQAQQIQSPICPKCSSSMILRVSKKGENVGNQFWGCSAFPRCRGVVQI